jgi:hypothetical protein
VYLWASVLVTSSEKLHRGSVQAAKIRTFDARAPHLNLSTEITEQS